MDKATLRHRLLAQRALITPEARLAAGEKLVHQFPAYVLDRPCIHFGSAPLTVAAYVSMGSEVETRPLLAWLLASGIRVLVPLLGSGLDIGWSALDSMESLHPVAGSGHRRPDEPQGTPLPPEALHDADLIIAPALAVDRHGNRLGRGAGWYDRALVNRRPGCPIIAVCWPWEVVDDDEWIADPHDVPADGVLTPEGYRQLQDYRRIPNIRRLLSRLRMPAGQSVRAATRI